MAKVEVLKSDKIVPVIFISLLLSLLFQTIWFLPLILLALILTAILYLKDKKLFFYLLLFLVPIDRFYIPFFFRLKIYHILVVTAVIFEMSSLFIKRYKISWHLNQLDFIVLAIYIARVFSIFITVDLFSTIKALILYGLFLILYFYIRSKEQELDPRINIQFLIYSSIFFTCFGIAELVLAKIGILSIQVSKDIYVYGGRPASVFREPDWFGGYLTFILSLTLAFFYNSQDHYKIRIRNIIVYLFTLIMFILIVVRSAWLGFIFGIISVLLVSNKARRILVSPLLKNMILLVFMMIAFWFLSATHFKSIHDRFSSISNYFSKSHVDAAAQVRLNSYETILKYIEKRPLQGYGAGSWEFLSQRHEHINPSLSANNLLLTPIFEMGIIGAGLYLFFIFFLLKIAFSVIGLASKVIDLEYAVGIAIAIVGTLVVSIFNDIMLTGFYWAFLALFVNFYVRLKNNPENR